MHFKSASRIFVLTLVGGAFALPALAQWQWLDKDGRKVFSDRSPPADIQENRILNRPGSSNRIAAIPKPETDPAAASAAPAPVVASKSNAPKLVGKDAQLEARKKQAEDEESGKKKAEEEKVTRNKTENCERARKGMASLQAGGRLSLINAKGEREIMDDDARAAETKRLQAIADSSCG